MEQEKKSYTVGGDISGHTIPVALWRQGRGRVGSLFIPVDIRVSNC